MFETESYRAGIQIEGGFLLARKLTRRRINTPYGLKLSILDELITG